MGRGKRSRKLGCETWVKALVFSWMPTSLPRPMVRDRKWQPEIGWSKFICNMEIRKQGILLWRVGIKSYQHSLEMLTGITAIKQERSCALPLLIPDAISKTVRQRFHLWQTPVNEDLESPEVAKWHQILIKVYKFNLNSIFSFLNHLDFWIKHMCVAL